MVIASEEKLAGADLDGIVRGPPFATIAEAEDRVAREVNP
jgi:hypothetical protein